MTVTQKFSPLPFPVRDRSDVLRAVRYAEKHFESAEIVEQVSRRARQLGCADILPSHWNGSVKQWRVELSGLDGQIRRHAERLGVSDAKLKTVYLRGVRDFKASEMDLGTAGMWGLARLQRFITACQNANPDITEDVDLLYDDVAEEHETFDLAITSSVDGGQKALEIMQAPEWRLNGMFHPGVPTSMEFDSANNVLRVEGRLDKDLWTYTLDLETAEEKLELHD